MTAQHEAIIAELYKAVERLGGSRELLGVIGSWGDTLSDEDVLEALRRLNDGGRLFDEIWASTGGPGLDVEPSPRRSPKRRRGR